MAPKKHESTTETAVKKAGARVAATVANAKAVMPRAEASQPEPTQAPGPARATKAKKAAVASTTNEVAPTTPPVAMGGIPLSDLAEQYLKHLEATGKSRGTVFSYSLDLNVAARHFGRDRDTTSITREEVTAYFDSAAVQTNRGGAPKNPITTAKLQRTVRQMFAFAEESGIVVKSPVAPLEKKIAKSDTSDVTATVKVDDSEPVVITHDPAAQAALGTLKQSKRGRKPKATVNAADETPVAATGA